MLFKASISNLMHNVNIKFDAKEVKIISWNETMRDIRKEAGETQLELAKTLGWSRPQIQRYEKGEPPTIEYLIAFCKHYNIDPNRILFEDLNDTISK